MTIHWQYPPTNFGIRVGDRSTLLWFFFSWQGSGPFARWIVLSQALVRLWVVGRLDIQFILGLFRDKYSSTRVPAYSTWTRGANICVVNCLRASLPSCSDVRVQYAWYNKCSPACLNLLHGEDSQPTQTLRRQHLLCDICSGFAYLRRNFLVVTLLSVWVSMLLKARVEFFGSLSKPRNLACSVVRSLTIVIPASLHSLRFTSGGNDHAKTSTTCHFSWVFKYFGCTQRIPL